MIEQVSKQNLVQFHYLFDLIKTYVQLKLFYTKLQVDS